MSYEMAKTWREVLGAECPEGLKGITALLASANNTTELSPEVVELVTIAAALAARARGSVVPHVKKARELGVSDASLYEVLMLAATIGGMPVLTEGIEIYADLGVGSASE